MHSRPTDARTAPRRSRKRRRRLLAIVGAGIAAALLAALIAARTPPSWYDPAVVGPDAAQEVRDDLLRTGQRFSDGMQAGEPFEFVVRDEQINPWLWLTERERIWPGIDRYLPAEIDDPMVFFSDGAATAACTIGPRTQWVLSFRVKVRVVEGRVHARLTQWQVGSLPLPVGLARTAMRRAGVRLALPDGRPLDPARPVVLVAEGKWISPRRRFRIEDVRFDPGELVVKVVPLRDHR